MEKIGQKVEKLQEKQAKSAKKSTNKRSFPHREKVFHNFARVYNEV
jgi:hypothetical protein